jgi:hypothetical protein
VLTANRGDQAIRLRVAGTPRGAEEAGAKGRNDPVGSNLRNVTICAQGGVFTAAGAEL